MDTTTTEIRHFETETHPANAPHEEQDDEVSLLDLLIILARSKWFIIRITIGLGLTDRKSVV